MKIHKIHNLNEYMNRYRNKIFSFAEHVKILTAYNIYDYGKYNHKNLQKVSLNTMEYYDINRHKHSFIQTMRYVGYFQNPMFYRSEDHESFSDVIKENTMNKNKGY